MIRTRNIFKPGENKGLYPLSRSKIDDFLKCKRCFYLDRRLGISKPSSIPFNLNNAVDKLLKKEFDNFRDRKEPHPLMMEYGIDGIPMQHPSLEIWRQNFKGVRTPVFGTDLEITGAVDDLWVNQHAIMIKIFLIQLILCIVMHCKMKMISILNLISRLKLYLMKEMILGFKKLFWKYFQF